MSQLDEPWVRAALSDDRIVADFLVRLHGSVQQPPTTTTVTPLNWTVRQRRSRPPPHHDASKKPSQHLRASPSTPLSLSAGTSQDGSEESTRTHAHVSRVSYPARSKLQVNEDSEKAVSKKSRKRKTLAELRDEEISLVRERRELKREITAFRLNLEKQWAMNEKLKKRMKNELQLIPERQSNMASVPNTSILPPRGITEADVSLQHSSSNACPRKNADSTSCNLFAIPDLNLPFEEDASAEVLCGVS